MGSTTPTRRALASFAALAAALVVGAALRAYDRDYGLPSRIHPDEPLLIEPAQRISHLEQLDFHPRILRYPSLPIYALAGALAVDRALGHEPAEAPAARARAVLVARDVTVAVGVATIAVVFLLARELAGRRAAALAAFLFAVAPVPAVDAHYANVNVPLTFFASLATWGLVRWQRGLRARDLLLAAAAIGLAGGCKYNGLALGLAVPATAIALVASGRLAAGAAVRSVALAGGVAALAFLATTPYVLLDVPFFASEIARELDHQARGHPGADVVAGEGIYRPVVYQLVAGLPMTLGIATYPLSLVGAALFAARARSGAVAFLAALAALLAPLVVSKIAFVRYLMPLAPLLCAAAGVAVARLESRAARAAGTAVAAIAAATTLATTAGMVESLSPMPAEETSRWLAAHVARGDAVGVVGGILFHLDGATGDGASGDGATGDGADGAFAIEPASLRRLATGVERPRWLVVDTWERNRLRRPGDARPRVLEFARQLGDDASPYVRRAAFAAHYPFQRAYLALDPAFASYPLLGAEIFERRVPPARAPH
ncbi:MAG: glycosyltransferase family 39 protein [Myxococcota bacterium]